jgi:predicted dinucleotide-binding enzyme
MTVEATSFVNGGPDEWVARHLPGARVIEAFNAMAGAYVAAEPRHAERRQVVFHAGDDVGLADGGRLRQLD